MIRLFSPILRASFALLVLTGSWLSARAAEEDPSIAEMKVVDADMARFTEMLKVYDDPYYKPRVMVYYNAIALRIEALRKSFDQQKADDLRYDLNQQIQRMAVALRPLLTPPPGTRPLFELSRLKPSPGNPAEVTAALAALDAAIDRLETEANTATSRRAELQAKLARAREGRAALAKAFTADGWTAVTKDLETPLRMPWKPRPTPAEAGVPGAVARQ